MSFSSSGVKLHTKWNRGAFFTFLTRAAEAVLSVVFVITLAAPIVFPNQAQATLGVSQKLSYQGRLTDVNGNPLTGTYCVRFSVYDAVSAGNKLWPSGTPASNSLTVTNGVFNVGVGDAETLDFDFSSNDTTYLNVEVNATPTTCAGAWEGLSPRQRLDAVAYARVAAGVYGPALAATSTIVRIGAGTGAGTPVWLNLDNKNTASTLGGACPSGSVNGSLWYNSSGTRALMCLNNVIVGVDNTNEITSLNIGGNTAGTPTVISAGAITLAGGNNITLSQNGSTITVSGASPVMGLGISNIGNTSGTSGTGTGTVFFAGGNNITLSQSTAAGARTITISAFNQSVQPVAISGSNGSFAFSTVSFGNLNGMSFYTSNGSIVGSYTAGGGGGAAIQGSGTYSQNTGTVQFANSNGITFGLSNNGTMTASHNGLTVQSVQPVAISGSNGSFAFSTVTFGNLNGLSFYTSNGSIVGSYTAGGGGGAVPQRWTQIPDFRFSLSNLTNITAISNVPFFQPFRIDGTLTVSRVNYEMSRATSGSNAFSVTAGIYSYVNDTQISLLGSAVGVYSNTATASVSGIRRFGISGFDVSTFAPGGYIFGMMFNAGANTASMNYSIRGYSGAVQLGAVNEGTNNYNTATSYNIFPFFGRYSNTVAAFPSSVADSQIRGQFSGASAPLNAWIGLNND